MKTSQESKNGAVELPGARTIVSWLPGEPFPG